MAGNIWLIRHGETSWSRDLLHTGRTDIPLTEIGAWEGRTTKEIRAELDDPNWVVWQHLIPPGNTLGEQLTDVAIRVTRVIERCLPEVLAGHDCVLVAHGHVLRILTATWLGLPPIDGRLFALDPARLSALGFEHEQKVIKQWNA
jgi:probable phosphoglycerate mutase